MDTLRWILIVFLTLLSMVVIIGQMNGLDEEAFTIVIVLSILFIVFAGLTYAVMYSTHKAENKIKKLKESRELNQKELWKNDEQENKSLPKTTNNLNSGAEINKMVWLEISESLERHSEMKKIIKDFLIKDEIDFAKYTENEKADEISKGCGLENWERINNLSEFPKPSTNCTPHFKEHFANDSLKRSPFVANWFYIAYPDVEIWVHRDMKIIEPEFSNNKDFYLTNGRPNNNIYRLMINKYKSQGLNLECSVD